MRVGILDLGTNTFNLLIGEISDSSHEILYSGRQIAKLGEGGLHENRITEEAYQRGLSAIEALLKITSEYNCEELVAYATSGIRSTTNGPDFIAEVGSKYGVSVEVISGDREAELIWKGVRLCTDLDKPCLIMDIGGGSTEFILANKEQIFWKSSLQLGASRLKEVFRPSDPIDPDNIQKLLDHFNNTLKELLKVTASFEKLELIGSSGSFDTFADMMLFRQNREGQLKDQNTIEIPLEEFAESYEFLITSTYEQRLKTPGIIPMRADMIVISGLLTKYVIDSCKINRMYLSKYALKEGALSEYGSSN